MAVNDVRGLYRSAENEVNCIIEYMKMDKRTDKKWNEKVMNSALNIRNSLKVFKTLLEAQASPSAEPNLQSYASVLHERRSTQIDVQSTRNVVIVSPKSPDIVSDSEQTLKLVQSATRNKLRVGVNNVKKIRNKSVLFELRNKDDCSEFLQTVQNNCANIIAKIPEKRNPRIIIHGIEASFPEEELVEAITEQNPWVKQCLSDPTEQLVKRFIKHSRNGRTQYAVMEVTPKLYRAVMQRGKLYTGYSSCPVKDHIHVVRSHNCSAFGHISADCNSPNNAPTVQRSTK
jgi:hypothetical protein